MNSLGLGVLMNTRALVELVELVVLNAALDLGVLSPVLLTMMVLMALVTTFMAAPILTTHENPAVPGITSSLHSSTG